MSLSGGSRRSAIKWRRIRRRGALYFVWMLAGPSQMVLGNMKTVTRTGANFKRLQQSAWSAVQRALPKLRSTLIAGDYPQPRNKEGDHETMDYLMRTGRRPMKRGRYPFRWGLRSPKPDRRAQDAGYPGM